MEMFLKIFFMSPELNCSIIFLDVHVFHDEEDESISSMFQIRRVHIHLYNTSVQDLFPMGTVVGEEPTGSLICAFALAFEQNLSHPILTQILRAELLVFPAHCCSNSSQTCLIHKKF